MKVQSGSSVIVSEIVLVRPGVSRVSKSKRGKRGRKIGLDSPLPFAPN